MMMSNFLIYKALYNVLVIVVMIYIMTIQSWWQLLLCYHILHKALFWTTKETFFERIYSDCNTICHIIYHGNILYCIVIYGRLRCHIFILITIVNYYSQTPQVISHITVWLLQYILLASPNIYIITIIIGKYTILHCNILFYSSGSTTWCRGGCSSA